MNIEKASKIVSVIFIIIGLVLVLGKRGWFPDFYNPVFMGAMALIDAFLIILPRLIFRPVNSDQKSVLNIIQAILVIALILNGLGTLGLYKIILQYDLFVHFSNSLIFMIAAAELCHRWLGMNLKKSIILSLIIVFFSGIYLEMFEFSGDVFLKTQMRGYYGQSVAQDTIRDVIMNCFGIIAAALGLIISKKRNDRLRRSNVQKMLSEQVK